MSRYYRSILNVQQGVILDPDAEAYLNVNIPELSATFLEDKGITLDQYKQLINNAVISAKDFGLWSKMKAIYPISGGTAGAHKWNLKDPRDLDAAFRLTFVGSPTHSANGMQGNGSSQYARTHLTPSISLAQNNASGFCYINLTGNRLDFGSQSFGGLHGILIGTSVDTSTFFSRINNSTASSTLSTDLVGFFGVSRLVSGSFTENRNGVIATRSIASTGLSNVQIHLMGYNDADLSTLGLSNKRYSFFSFGEGLDSTQQGNLKTIIDTFQTALGRA